MVLECGKTYEMGWVAQTWTADFIKHNKKGKFILDLANCDEVSTADNG